MCGRLRDRENERVIVARAQLILLATVEGAMLGAIWHHTLRALVSAPVWIYVTIACGVAFSLVRTAHPAKWAGWVALGIFFGSSLPPSLAPPDGRMMTHAPTSPRGVDLFEALERVDEDSQGMLGRRVSVEGFWRPTQSGNPAAVFLPVMACCAADAVDVGFDVLPRHQVTFNAGTTVRVSGIVAETLANGEIRYRLAQATVERPVSSARNSGAKRRPR